MNGDEQECAFPVIEPNGGQILTAGMSLRDYFAAQALAGILANAQASLDAQEVASKAFECADAMVLARE